MPRSTTLLPLPSPLRHELRQRLPLPAFPKDVSNMITRLLRQNIMEPRHAKSFLPAEGLEAAATRPYALRWRQEASTPKAEPNAMLPRYYHPVTPTMVYAAPFHHCLLRSGQNSSLHTRQVQRCQKPPDGAHREAEEGSLSKEKRCPSTRVPEKAG